MADVHRDTAAFQERNGVDTSFWTLATINRPFHGLAANVTGVEIMMASSSAASSLTGITTFEREADMLSPLRDHVDVVLSGSEASTKMTTPNDEANSWSVLFEVQAANGIVDVLYVRPNQNGLALRKAEGKVPITNWNDLLVFGVLQTCSARPMSVAEIAVKTGFSPSGLRRGALARLESAGHITSTSKSKGFLPTWQYMLPVTRLVAVEAKRADWRRAATQASRHTAFADGSFLAVPPAAGRRAVEQQKIVSHAQLGVLSVDPATRMVTSLSPAPYPSRQPRRAFSRMFVAEQALHLIWCGADSGPVQPVFGRMLTTSHGADPRISQLN